MGRKLFISGRALFFVLLGVQCLVLALYSVYYGKNYAFGGLAASYGVVPIIWTVLFCCCNARGQVRWLWLVWLFYSTALVTMTGFIYGTIVIENKLHKDGVYGPNMLKTMLCIAPVEVLLMLNTATDIPEYQRVLSELSFTATINLFDGIEMLEVLLEGADGTPQAVSMEMKKIILSLVCVLFLISFLELLQIQFKEDPDELKVRLKVFCIHNIFQCLLNTLFLVLRIVLWVKHDRDAAIFMTKNLISLILILVRVLFNFGVV